MGQSIVLSEIKAGVPLANDIPSHQNLLLQRYGERIKLHSQGSNVSKFCMDAGFKHVVEVGQYFMTKDTGDFRQFHTVACLEYTLPRDDGSSQPRGWIQGNPKSDPYWKSRPGICTANMEPKPESVLADLPEEQASQSSVRVIAATSKAKAKPQKRETVDTPTIIPMHERKWIDIEPSEPTLTAYEVSKKVISLLRHNQTVQREKDGAIEFYRIKFYLRNHSSQVQHWSDEPKRTETVRGGHVENHKHDLRHALSVGLGFRGTSVIKTGFTSGETLHSL